MSNFTSSEEESDKQLYQTLLDDGALEIFERLICCDRLTLDAFESILFIISNIAVTDQKCRDNIIISRCYKLILQKYPQFSSPKINHAMSWLLCNLCGGSSTSNLDFDTARDILCRLKAICQQTSLPEVVYHTLFSLFYFLKDRSQRQERLKYVFADEYLINLVKEYLTTQTEGIKQLVLEVLAFLSEHNGPQLLKICCPAVLNEVIKMLKVKDFQGSDKLTPICWRFLTQMVASSNETAECVVRNDREMFVIISDHFLPLVSDQEKIGALVFLRTCFLALDLDRLKNILRSNTDLIAGIIGVLDEYEEGEALNGELVMVILETLLVMLRFGKSCELEEGENIVKERIQNCPDNGILDRMAKGDIGGTQIQKQLISDRTVEILTEFFEWSGE